jgi:AcrR family transcriptional regulator
MSEHVKSRRRYDATRRQEQARRTRAATLATARELFLSTGYSSTTMAAVAQAAGVSSQQVYKTFGNKAGLVKALFDVAMAGDDEPVVMVERQSLRSVREERDPRRKLRLYADFVASTAPRHVPIQLLVRAAADTDAEAAGLWRRLSDERLRGLAMFAAHLADELREGVTVDDARDLLWAHNSPELWDLLVIQRGWSPARFASHLADALIDALLPRPAAAHG